MPKIIINKLNQEIPDAITTAATSMLAPYYPGLTPDRLQNALMSEPEEQRTEKLLTRKEAAIALHVSLPTLDRMLASETLPRRRIRGAVRIPQSAIDAIIRGEVA